MIEIQGSGEIGFLPFLFSSAQFGTRREPGMGRAGRGVRGQRAKGVEAGGAGGEEGGGSRVYRELGEGVDREEAQKSSRGEDKGRGNGGFDRR